MIPNIRGCFVLFLKFYLECLNLDLYDIIAKKILKNLQRDINEKGCEYENLSYYRREYCINSYHIFTCRSKLFDAIGTNIAIGLCVIYLICNIWSKKLQVNKGLKNIFKLNIIICVTFINTDTDIHNNKFSP